MLNSIKGIFSNYIDFFYSIGYFGEYITFLITFALIFNKDIYLINSFFRFEWLILL